MWRRGLERQASAEHVLDEGRGGDQILEFKVEDALHPLHGERAQLGQGAQHTAEVRRPGHTTAATAAAARHVRPQTTDDLHLELLHSMRFFQTVSICN